MAATTAWNISMLSPPAQSLPRQTFTPSSSISRMGAVPEQRSQLESPQWTTVTPASFMALRSSSSDQTQWAMRVRSVQRPRLA